MLLILSWTRFINRKRLSEPSHFIPSDSDLAHSSNQGNKKLVNQANNIWCKVVASATTESINLWSRIQITGWVMTTLSPFLHLILLHIYSHCFHDHFSLAPGCLTQKMCSLQLNNIISNTSERHLLTTHERTFKTVQV